MTNEQAQVLVTRGAKLLDERVPGWWRRIRLETLKMSDCSLCVLGQLFGHDVETALGAEVFGLPIDADDRHISLHDDKNGWQRGRRILKVSAFDIGCGPNQELKCAWAEVIAGKLVQDEHA